MVATSKRTLWKGAIFFGLVHIPIALHPATSEQALNFDWLDKRSMDADIAPIYMDRPYYVSPINKGAKVYALLREILIKNRKAAIARVVIQTKQHLAALMSSGPMLILCLLRWGDEIRTFEE